MNSVKTLWSELQGALPLVRWRRLFVAAVLFWTPVIVFSKIANEVREREVLRFDSDILLWLRSQSTPSLNAAVSAFTELGGVIVVSVSILCLVVYLWTQHRRRMAVFAAAAVGGAGIINFILKHGFERQRPTILTALATESGYSFPSGHAMLSSALALAIILVVWHTAYRWLAIGIGALYILSIGMSRLYLGVHYPTDVLAGWCVSAAWVLIVYTVVLKGGFLLQPRTKPKRASHTKHSS